MTLSVKAKLTFLTTSAVIITALVLASVSARREFSSISEELERRGLMVCELTSKIVSEPLSSLDITAMHAALIDTMRFDDAEKAVIVEATGRIVAAVLRDSKGLLRGFETGLLYNKSDKFSAAEASTFLDSHQLVVLYPVLNNGRIAGHLKMYFSLEQTRARVVQTAWNVAFTGLFWAAAVIALTMFGARRMVKPLQLLSRAADNFGSGDLSARVSLNTGDEYEELGNAFNSMANDIQAGIQRLKSANIDLDKNLQLLKELHEFSVKLSSIFDIDELLQKCVKTLCRVLNSKRCSLLLRRPDDKGWYIKVAQGMAENPETIAEGEPANGQSTQVNAQEKQGRITISRDVPLPEEGAVAGWVSRNRMPLLVVDSSSDSRISPSSGRSYSCRSFISTPLIANNELIGILSVTEKDDNDSVYSEWELSALNTFANQVAVAIENSRLHNRLIRQSIMERELELARDIQCNMLPSVCPDISGVDIAASSVPATAVGGDFYDFLVHKGDNITSIIGDVSGKGMPAAILMAMTKGFMRTRLLACENPAQILANLNNFVYEQMHCTKYLTMFLCRLNRQTLKLEFCNGGHNYPLLIHADGSIDYLQTGDALVGMFDDFEFHCSTTCLKPGDMLLAYTDGLTESMNDKEEMLGEKAIEQAAVSMRHLPAEQILAKLFELASSHAGGQEQFDDITAFVLKVES